MTLQFLCLLISLRAMCPKETSPLTYCTSSLHHFHTLVPTSEGTMVKTIDLNSQCMSLSAPLTLV